MSDYRSIYRIEDLIPIVSELTKKYTCNESTSVSYETAKMLMEAVIYCINEIDDPSSEDHYSEQITESYLMDARSVYEAGYRHVIDKTQKAGILYHKIIEDFRYYRNQAYYETIVKGMPSFFLYYDAKFRPQDQLLTLDYPIIRQSTDLSGIDAVYDYLKCVSLEQEFLAAFSDEKVYELLIRYRQDYEILFINICRIVLRQAIACVIADRQVSGLELNENDIFRLEGFVLSSSENDLKTKFRDIIYAIVKQGFGGDNELCRYLYKDVDDFSAEIINAARNGCVESIVTFWHNDLSFDL